MEPIPTAEIPVTGLREVENSRNDKLCVSARGQGGWGVQVIRAARGGRVFLHADAPNDEALQRLVNQFLSGDYGSFEEQEARNGTFGLIWRMLVGLVCLLFALAFVAFMISLFLRLEW